MPASAVRGGDERECGWIAALPPAAAPPRRLLATEHAECAVVGAGLTGLAVARRLAEQRPGWRILLLDAGRAGAGASGRSSGFVVDLPDFALGMPPEHRDRYWRVAASGLAALRELVRRHAIDCAWDDSGFLRGAAGEAALRLLAPWPQRFDALGVPYEPLDAAALREITGTGFYRAGLRLPGTALVQPAALVRGIREALPANVELFEESPVRVEPGRGEIRLASTADLGGNGGTVHARQVFLTTNGYTPALGFLRRRVFPMLTFASLTRPLTIREQAALGGHREWGVLAVDPMGSTVRRTRDQRILIRNTLCYRRGMAVGAGERERIAGQHRAALLARFPMLADVPFEHTWTGLFGASANRQHFFGRAGGGLFATAGYNGAGIAMGTAAGSLLADLALGVDSEGLRDLLALPLPTWMPPEPLFSLGGWWRVARLNSQAGAYL
jgi:glycine/D-amino acid oxidase-like deaminating enzyme